LKPSINAHDAEQLFANPPSLAAGSAHRLDTQACSHYSHNSQNAQVVVSTKSQAVPAFRTQTWSQYSHKSQNGSQGLFCE